MHYTTKITSQNVVTEVMIHWWTHVFIGFDSTFSNADVVYFLLKSTFIDIFLKDTHKPYGKWLTEKTINRVE